MTPEEAIRVIEVAKAECEWSAPLDFQAAFDMAIKALKEQTEITYCKDCIHWINKHLCEIWSRYGTIETKSDFYCGNGQKEVKKHE